MVSRSKFARTQTAIFTSHITKRERAIGDSAEGTDMTSPTTPAITSIRFHMRARPPRSTRTTDLTRVIEKTALPWVDSLRESPTD